MVVQADTFSALPSATMPRLASDIQAEHLTRLSPPPAPENGLRAPSQLMIDKTVTVPRERIGTVTGRLDAAMMRTVGRVSWAGVQ